MHHVIEINVENAVKNELGVFLAYAILSEVTVKDSDADEIYEMEKAENYIRKMFPNIGHLRHHRIIKALRDFYWKIGIDPTKKRPSSEALIRRILRGQKLPLINNVVDAGNIVSVKTQIPIGIYDIDKIVGKRLILRYSMPGEIFTPIGGSSYKLHGEPCLSDNVKIIHLYPHRDSEYTKVEEKTKNILALTCGVPGIKISELIDALDDLIDLLHTYADGRLIYKGKVL